MFNKNNKEINFSEAFAGVLAWFRRRRIKRRNGQRVPRWRDERAKKDLFLYYLSVKILVVKPSLKILMSPFKSVRKMLALIILSLESAASDGWP